MNWESNTLPDTKVCYTLCICFPPRPCMRCDRMMNLKNSPKLEFIILTERAAQ
ncbi:hypothetical protein CY34DRAFT_269233, partial [Suillus luteus UH-Slu-Lm8-n1]